MAQDDFNWPYQISQNSKRLDEFAIWTTSGLGTADSFSPLSWLIKRKNLRENDGTRRSLYRIRQCQKTTLTLFGVHFTNVKFSRCAWNDQSRSVNTRWEPYCETIWHLRLVYGMSEARHNNTAISPRSSKILNEHTLFFGHIMTIA